MTVSVGEIRLLAGERVPEGWMICDGRSLDSSQPQYAALYAAIGRTYGSTAPGQFSLPDLRARVPIHRGPAYALGISGGAETVALTIAQIPGHSHTLFGTDTTATQVSPGGNLPAQSLRFDGYQASVPGAQQMGMSSIGEFGKGKPHENLQPFLCVNFIIAFVPSSLPRPKANVVTKQVRPAGTKAARKAKPATKAQTPPKAKPVAKGRPAAKPKPQRKPKSKAKPIKAKAPARRAKSKSTKLAKLTRRTAASTRNAASKATSKKRAGKPKGRTRSAPRTAAKRRTRR